MSYRRPGRALVIAALAFGSCVAVARASAAAELAVVAITPPRHTLAAPTTTIAITFDRAVQLSSVDANSIRVFGRGTGTTTGTFSFSSGNTVVTLTPDEPFSAGEVVTVNLSHDLTAADTSPLRSAGYAWQFTVAAAPGPRTFQFLTAMSNRTNPGTNTRIYGAQATDLNHDRYLDLATVNEDSGDVRVFRNLADGTGFYDPNFLSPEAIGLEASPNEQADFDNDGDTDGCFSATSDQAVWILLGKGDLTYGAGQRVVLGGAPHGVAVLDVDGDGDSDIVDANVDDNNLSLLLNNGSGVFGAPTDFDGGVNGEYGLAAGDMNNDGIMDLVVASRNGQEIRTLLGNGDGTFSAAAIQSSGGFTWVVVLGDVNGDGDLDAAVANSVSGNGALLLGNGDGTFGAPTVTNTGSHTPSVDLGDLDGDGDQDVMFSIFSGGEWQMYANDGAGTLTFDQDFTALNNPSCSILLDFDNDGDIDLALTDEIADVVFLYENVGTSAPTPTPTTTTTPTPRPTCTPAAPDPTPTPLSKGGLKCQRTLTKELSRFVKAKVKALQGCHDALMKDKLAPDPGPGGGGRLAFCLAEPATDAKIDKAASKLGVKIAKACGGPDKTCGTADPGEETPAAFGFYATCPDFEGLGCAGPIGDCGDVAACLECVGSTATEQSLVLYYDDLVDTDPSTQKTLNTCQRTIGKETAKYLLDKEKRLQKCWDARMKGKHADTCPDAGAPFGSTARKTAEKIAKAESKKIVKICKACGGDDRACDTPVTPVNPLVPVLGGSGGGDDVTPAAIGFPAICTDLKIPGGGPFCDVQVSTLADVVRCVDCVTEFKVDCMDAARVPSLLGRVYPCECTP
jgi:hypothetical protein